MLPYIIYILLTLVLSLFYDGQEEFGRQKKAWYIVVCLYLILLAGFRNGVGGDTQQYMAAFEFVPTQLNYLGSFIQDEITISGYMPGWSVLVFFCKKWFDSFYAVQIIQAIIVNISVFYLFRKYTTHIFLCALLYGISDVFFMYNMEVMREAIAVVLCGIGMHHYVQGHKWKLFVFIGIALLFHVSALIALLFPITLYKQITLREMVISFLVAVALFFLSDVIVTHLPSMLGSSAAKNAQKVLLYSEKTLNIFGFLRNSFRYLVIEAGMVFFAQGCIAQDDETKQKTYLKYMNFYLLITILICSFIGFERFKNYTLIFFVVMLTEYLYNFKSQLSTNAMLKVIVLAGLIVYCVKYYANPYPENRGYRYEFYTPYTSILDDDVDTSHRQAMHQEANFKVDHSRKSN